jgi:hypothetical protein
MLVAQGESPLDGPDALSFLQNGYRNRNLPEQFRAYCANAALSYERVKPVTVGGRSVDEIREEIRREIHEEQHREGEEALEKLMDQARRRREATPPSERVRRALTNALTGEDDQLSEADRALIDDIVARVVERHPVDRHISEIAPPPQPLIVVRKRPSPVIEGEALQQDCDAIDKPVVPKRAADIGTANRPPVLAQKGAEAASFGSPQPQRSLWDGYNGHDAAVVVYAAPWASFQVRSGRRFVAAEDGLITAEDKDDLADLLRAGCSVAPRD